MDGTGSTIIFSSPTVEWPNALTLDYETDTLYWIDASRGVIGKSNSDGSDLNIIQTLSDRNDEDSTVYVYSMDYFQGRLYWGEWLQDRIYTLEDGAPEGSVRLMKQLEFDPGEMHVVDSARQPTNTSPST